MLTNLLINADHAIEGQGDIYVHSRLEGEEIILTVKDTGKGISPDNLKEIFNPFFTTKPIGQGTGLGLSICYDIILEHHGNISVDSQVGQGTCFTISLPIHPPVEATEIAGDQQEIS